MAFHEPVLKAFDDSACEASSRNYWLYEMTWKTPPQTKGI